MKNKKHVKSRTIDDDRFDFLPSHDAVIISLGFNALLAPVSAGITIVEKAND